MRGATLAVLGVGAATAFAVGGGELRPLAAGALALLTAATWYRYIRPAERRLERAAKGLCLRCGYDLTGNISGVCPECGQPR